jgi:pilus assembly protein CpaE
LAAPPNFDDARTLTSVGVNQAILMARSIFPQTVVDVEDCFHDEQVTVLQQATGILLIGRLDFTSLRNARRVLDQLHKLGINRLRVKIVINHHGQASELPLDEAEDALNDKLTRFVPYDPKTINLANNMGIPAAIKDPNTKMSRAIVELAKIDFDNTTGASGLIPRLRNLWQAIA